MNVLSACPKCGRMYAISVGLVGHELVCTNKECGTSFTGDVARTFSDPNMSTLVFDELPELAEDQSTRETLEDFEPPRL